MKLRRDVTEVLEIITFPKWKNEKEQDDVAPIDEADYEANKDATEGCPVQCVKLE